MAASVVSAEAQTLQAGRRSAIYLGGITGGWWEDSERQQTSSSTFWMACMEGGSIRKGEGGGDPRNVLLDYAEPQNVREWGRGGLDRISVKDVPRVAK